MATLSISSPGDYHYVTIPTNMTASLTGVGMGSEAPSGDAPLRYEDAAFLTEAYAERARAFNSYSSASNVPLSEVSAEIDLTHLRSFYNEAFNVGDTYRPLAYGYADPDAKLLEGVARAVNYEAANEAGKTFAYDRDVWKDIFVGGADPFLVAAIDASSISSGLALTSGKICSFYSELNRLTRPALRCSMLALAPPYKSLVKQDSDYSKWVISYNTVSGSWECGEHSTTNTSSSFNNPFIMYYDTGIQAGRKKSQQFEYDPEKKTWSAVTGVKESQYALTHTWTTAGDVYVSCEAAFAKLGARRIKAVKIFGRGYYSMYMFTSSGTGTLYKKEGYFITEIPSKIVDETNADIIMVELGNGLRHKKIADSVKGLFSDPGYDTGEELLNAVPTPGAVKGEGAFRESSYEECVLHRFIRMDTFYAVFDVEFNARLPSDGE